MIKETNGGKKYFDYFSYIFKDNHKDLILPSIISFLLVFPVMNEWSMQQPLEEDVKGVLFSIKSGKAIGPDCFTAGFFQLFWPEMKSVVI